jgi:hypothetical protein
LLHADSSSPAGQLPNPSFEPEDRGSNDEDTWKLVYFIRHFTKMTAQEIEAMKN